MSGGRCGYGWIATDADRCVFRSVYDEACRRGFYAWHEHAWNNLRDVDAWRAAMASRPRCARGREEVVG